MKTVHLAGNSVSLDDRIIQRCLICGEKLCDSKNVAAPINPDGTPGEFLVWQIGTWVEQDGIQWLKIGSSEKPHFEGYEIPDGCCIELVEL